MISPSLVRFRKAAVLTHSVAFSPTNVMQRSIKEAAHFEPARIIESEWKERGKKKRRKNETRTLLNLKIVNSSGIASLLPSRVCDQMMLLMRSSILISWPFGLLFLQLANRPSSALLTFLALVRTGNRHSRVKCHVRSGWALITW